MKTSSVLAPNPVEKPTLVERFVKLIPLPYPLAALIWSLALPSSVGGYAIHYFMTGESPVLLSIPNAFLNPLLPFYLFMVVRYMRLRIVAAEAPIAARLSGGEKDYHRAFGRITQTFPVVLLTVALGTLLLVSYALSGMLTTVPLVIAFNVIIVYLNVLAFSTYLWEFATTSLGLHKLGGSSLKLASFLEDRMMGAKPMGNLALSLTTTYFGGLLITFLLFSTFTQSSNLTLSTLFYVFLLLGVALFFLPLNSIHAKMQAEKRRLMREIGARYPRLEKGQSKSRETTLEDVNTRLDRLTDLQEVEMLDRKAASLPTWPFDIQVVSKFVTIVLSVTAVLLSRLITGFLHI